MLKIRDENLQLAKFSSDNLEYFPFLSSTESVAFILLERDIF